MYVFFFKWEPRNNKVFELIETVSVGKVTVHMVVEIVLRVALAELEKANGTCWPVVN